MRRTRKSRPCIEILEDRFCPSLTIESLSSDLLISGTPVGTSGLSITGNGGKYQIVDGSTNKGTFSANSIIMNLQHYNEPITVD